MASQQDSAASAAAAAATRIDAPEARVLRPGLDRQGVKADKHPAWYPPREDAGTAAAHPLRILNSFTERVERFVPQADYTSADASDGAASASSTSSRKRVTWYTCGPTVYDVSHMGHARAYLTFDILRRVFETYFGYEVVMQMNVTDIDDKIIKRARIGKLLADYEKANGAAPLAAVQEDVAKAKAFGAAVLAQRKATLDEPLPANAQSRVVEEREEKKKELELKLSQFDTAAKRIDEVIASKPASSLPLIQAATSLLGDWLDHERGATVTDNAIFDAHARKYERLFFEDLDALNIKRPDVVTRVSEVVPEVVSFVQKIIANGYAYLPTNVEKPSSIFFDTQRYIADGHDYPKLKPVADHLRNATATTEDEMAEGEGSLSSAGANEKKHPNDFALWKFSKAGEPGWASAPEWGPRPGRPGWHIECSVMASGVLGPSMDIHAGGCDLKFPHHDNELAQSEAFWGHSQWVNYFLHCGHLHIKGLKMSKSLKNFITIRQAMDPEGELKITSRQMRLLFLMNDWHRPLNFSDQSVDAARKTERTLRSFFGAVDIVMRSNWLAQAQTFGEADKELMGAWRAQQDAVHAALCNNIDTVGAMDAVMALVTAGNKYLNATAKDNAAATQPPNATVLEKVASYITKILRVFGVVNTSDGVGFEDRAGGAGDAASEQRLSTAMDALILLRDDVRRATREKAPALSVMPMCDKVRDDVLPAAGIRLEDKPGGATTWKKDDPAVLMRERAEAIALAKAKEAQKLQNQISTQEKLIAKWDKLARSPAEYFRGDAAEAAKFSAFDASSGLPTHDNTGAALDEKKVSKLKATQDSYAKQHAEYQAKGGDEWLGKLKAELAAMRADLAAATGEEQPAAGAAAAASK